MKWKEVFKRMNKSYTYVDGSIVIADEKGVQKQGLDSNNIDEILIIENVIETIENRLSKKGTELENTKSYNKANKNTPILIAIGMPIFMFLSCLVIGHLLGLTEVKQTIFGMMRSDLIMGIASTIVFIPISTLAGLYIHASLKRNLKTINGLEVEIDFLTHQLENEKNHLAQLESKKEVDLSKKEGFYVKEISDEKPLSQLKNLSICHFNCAYNEKKYLKLYRKGLLESKLKSKYGTNYEYVEKYIGEKVKTLKAERNK
jgi:hypothetical protein